MAVFKIGMAQHGATQPQQWKTHNNLVSLFADLFDCRKAMLEAGQPGELPLMRELSSLRRVRSLRDPSMGSNAVAGASSARTSSWKSPVAKTREIRYDHYNSGRSRDIKGVPSSARNAKVSKRRGGLSHSAASPFSDPTHTIKRETAWDLGMEPEEASIGIHVQCKPVIKAHRGDAFRQHKPTKNLYDDQFSLHKWRDPSWGSDMEASHATAYNESVDLPARGPRSRSRGAYELQNNVSHGRMNASTEMLERYQKSTLSGSRQHPKVLSPLVLNSIDDIHYHGNSFSLEGNYHERRNQPSRGALRGDIPSSQSPQYSRHAAGKGQRDATRSSWKSQHVLASSASTSQRSVSQSSMSGAWDATSNQLEDELDVCELPKNGCGIPCYWSKSQRRRKSLVDIAERSFACGLYSKSPKRMGHSGSKNYNSASQGNSCAYHGHEPVPPLDLEALPLLSDPSACSEDIVGSSADDSDKLSSDLNGELQLHSGDARSDVQDSASEGKELALYCERPRSLSQKYRPKVFEELVGQNIVAQALSNAVHKRKIAPVYLFQGSRGTGKTSAARIFAAALNCVTVEVHRPCGVCKECHAFTSGKSLDIREVDAASNNAVEKVKALLQTAFSAPSFSQFKVFIIDECHMLTNETWSALLKLLEEPPRNVVFILITTDPDKLPTMAVSRCQKFPFPKIKDSEIVGRLQALAKLENLYVEPGALDLVAARADGSLRDAEIILDQLSLLGQKITVSTVHELFGSVSDERLLDLLDYALSSDTVNTVQRARQLIDSGVEPLDLMVQLATLITDILAGSNDHIAKCHEGGFFTNQALSEEELERLRFALQVLSDAEKQLRAASNDRTTWLTAALLQLGPARPCAIVVSTSGTSGAASPIVKASSNGSRQVLKIINGRNNHKSMVKGSSQKKAHSLTTMKSKNRSSRSSFEVQVHPEDTSKLSSAASRDPSNVKVRANASASNKKRITMVGPGNLESIWWNVLERCKSPSIRQLLQSHGKLLAVSISADGALVFLEFDTFDSKSKSERCKKSIANFFQEVLGLSVEVKITLASITSVGARVQAIVDQQAVSSQGHSKQSSNAMPGQHEKKFVDVESLHYWRSQSQTASPQTLERANSTKSFPALMAISNNGRVADSDHAMRSLSGTPHFGSGGKPFKRAEISLYEGTRLGGSWNTKARIVSSIQRAQSGEGIQEIVSENGTENLGAEHVQCNAKAVPKKGFTYDLEEENLRLESQSKYGGLLCWRNPKVKDDKVSRHQQGGCAILRKFVPCANSKRR
eukprot:c24402_g1_i2 orf=567-4400(-)